MSLNPSEHSSTDNRKCRIGTTVKDKVMHFETAQNVGNGATRKKFENNTVTVKNKIQQFERTIKPTGDCNQKLITKDNDATSDDSNGRLCVANLKPYEQFIKDKVVLRVPPLILHKNEDINNNNNKDCDKYRSKQVELPHLLEATNKNYHSELNETSDVIIKQINNTTTSPSDVTTKPLWMGRDYLKQLSTEELLSNLRIIEQLRNSYIEEISEASESEKPEASSPLDIHDIAIYKEQNHSEDNEFGLSELCESAECDYIVEAYNVPENELVISELQFAHHETDEDPATANLNESLRDLEMKLGLLEAETQSWDSKECSPLSTNYENPVYMCLSEIRNAASLNNDVGETAQSKAHNMKGRDLQIEVAVSWSDGDEDEDTYSHNLRMFYDENPNSGSDEDNGKKTTPLEQIVYRIEEMVNTEEKYISDLEKVVKHYIPYLKKIHLPQELKGKQSVLFGNIADIYVQSKTFLKALKTCGYDHEKIAETFLKFKASFQLYPLYSKNKPEADAYLPLFRPFTRCKQEELGERLDLGSYLLTPIQRLGKYILFLKGINKELNKKHIFSTTVEAALNMIQKTMSRANDYIAIESITRCPIDLSKEAGGFLMRDKFNILQPNRNFLARAVSSQKSYQAIESMVFFFEAIIVFTLEASNEKRETFVYVDSIKMSDMTATPSDDPLIIRLENYAKRKRLQKEYVYNLQAKSLKMKQVWSQNIENRLWEQANIYKAEVNAQYREKLTVLPVQEDKKRQKGERSLTLPAESTSRRKKKTKSSTFYIRLT